MDLESDGESDELRAPLAGNPLIFDARDGRPAQRTMSDMPRAAQAAQDRDDEDVWAELG